MSDPTLVHLKIDAYGVTREDAIKAVHGALTHLGSGFNGGHGHVPGSTGRYRIEYDDGTGE